MTEVMIRLLCKGVAHQPEVVEGQGHGSAKRNSRRPPRVQDKRRKRVRRLQDASCVAFSLEAETALPHTSSDKTSDFGPFYLGRTNLDGDTGQGFGKD